MKHEQHWADPIQRPTRRERYAWLPVVYTWVLAAVAAGVIAWSAVV